MTALSPTELTTLITKARSVEAVRAYDGLEPAKLIAELADALESLSATTPTDAEWGRRATEKSNVVTYSTEKGARGAARMSGQEVVSRTVTAWVADKETP